MIYIGRDSADSFSCALTFGKKYNIYYDNRGNDFSNYWLKDDLGKGIWLIPDNFCSLSEWRDKQLDKIVI